MKPQEGSAQRNDNMVGGRRDALYAAQVVADTPLAELSGVTAVEPSKQWRRVSGLERPRAAVGAAGQTLYSIRRISYKHVFNVKLAT